MGPGDSSCSSSGLAPPLAQGPRSSRVTQDAVLSTRVSLSAFPSLPLVVRGPASAPISFCGTSPPTVGPGSLPLSLSVPVFAGCASLPVHLRTSVSDAPSLCPEPMNLSRSVLRKLAFLGQLFSAPPEPSVPVLPPSLLQHQLWAAGGGRDRANSALHGLNQAPTFSCQALGCLAIWRSSKQQLELGSF